MKVTMHQAAYTFTLLCLAAASSACATQRLTTDVGLATRHDQHAGSAVLERILEDDDVARVFVLSDSLSHKTAWAAIRSFEAQGGEVPIPERCMKEYARASEAQVRPTRWRQEDFPRTEGVSVVKGPSVTIEECSDRPCLWLRIAAVVKCGRRGVIVVERRLERGGIPMGAQDLFVVRFSRASAEANVWLTLSGS